MAFTRFHDDPCRIQKYLEESTNIEKYRLNVPGNGNNPYYINDPYIRIQKWGGNLSQNQSSLHSDLLGLTRKLNRDTIKENNYVDYLNNNNIYSQINYPVHTNEVTHQSRYLTPAWTLRELDSNNTPYVPNNFNFLHMNPQEHICIPFNNNISTRIVEKDYYVANKK